MVVQISAVNTDAESGNFIEMSASDGKTVVEHTTEFIYHDLSV